MSKSTRDGLDAARARGRTGGQKPKLTARQAKIVQDMYDELGPDGRRARTVQQIADEFAVTRPTIYRHLQR
jgi:DNA invertase Pin-like site-specific DNA recombinase